MLRYDVVIVGGGPAGISTALFLLWARPELAGRVVVIERATYPREKFCAGAVGTRALRDLARIGVDVRVSYVSIGGLAFRAQGRTVVVREPDAGRVVRRIEFDHALARAARKRGVIIDEGVRVGGLEWRHGGVDVRTDHQTYRAAVVVGADGVGSVVRRALRIDATPHRAQVLEVDTVPVDGDLDRDLLVLDATDRQLRGYYWDFPTLVDGREVVCRGVYQLRTGAQGKADIQAVLERELAERGLDLGKHRKKRYAERGFYPPASVSGSRVLLVGEAAGIDPVSGEGIAQAIQYGAVAGPYLAAKLERGTYDFGDWARTLRARGVGRDLLVRSAMLQLFYGRRRPDVERFILDTPEFIAVGLQHFSGKPWSKSATWRIAVGAARATVRATLPGRNRPGARQRR